MDTLSPWLAAQSCCTPPIGKVERKLCIFMHLNGAGWEAQAKEGDKCDPGRSVLMQT